MRPILYILLLILYALHNDLWLWDDGTLVYGLPAGFLYHIGYCAAASALLVLLVNFAWPRHLSESEGEEEQEDSRP